MMGHNERQCFGFFFPTISGNFLYESEKWFIPSPTGKKEESDDQMKACDPFSLVPYETSKYVYFYFALLAEVKTKIPVFLTY